MNVVVRSIGVVAVVAVLMATLSGCGVRYEGPQPTAVSGTYVLSLYPYDQQVAEAIQEYSTVPLEIIDERSFSGANFLGRVRWDAEASRSLGKPYEYRGGDDAQASENRMYLSSLFRGFSGVDVSQIFTIESTMQFSDYRTYDLPAVKTWDDQDTVDIFCRLVAKAAQYTSEGERRAILQLNNAVSIRALEQFQDRVERVEGTSD